MTSMKKRVFCALCIFVFMGSLFLGTNYQNNSSEEKIFANQSENQQFFQSGGVITPPPSQTQRNFTFSGQSQANTWLSFQGESVLTSDTNKDMKITTNKWNVSNILVNFTDIHSERLLHVENVTPPLGYYNIYNRSKISVVAMEFKMPLPSFVFNLKLYLRYMGNFTTSLQIWGATSAGAGAPTPKTPGSGYMAIAESKNLVMYGSVDKTEWVEFKFTPRTLKSFLNPNTTALASFFVIFTAIPTGGASSSPNAILQWATNPDGVGNPDSGAAYTLQGNTWVSLGALDLLLENITYSPLTWQDVFSVESEEPRDFVQVYQNTIVILTRDNAQQFQINTNSYLSNLSVYLKYRGQLSVWADIYNATESTSSNPGEAIPHKKLFASEKVSLITVKSVENWVKFRFLTDPVLNSSFLNIRNTYNYSFFVVIRATGSVILDSVDWGYIPDDDNGDQGLAYYWDSSQPPEYWWLEELDSDIGEPIDLALKDISVISYEYNPSTINLKINSSNVNDYTSFKFGGFKLLSGNFDGSRGSILLNTTATKTVTYQATWSCQFNNHTLALTSFKGYSLISSVQWNITLSTKYPVWNSSSQGLGKYSFWRINITLPTDHTVNRIYYNNIAYPSWNTSRVGDKQFVLIALIVGLSGNWRLQVFSPNYVEEVHAFNGTKELTQFYVKDNLNTTAKLKVLTSTSGVNLTIFNVSSKVVHTQTVIASAYWAKYALWTLPKNDSHFLVVSWYNGTEVGIRSLEIMCVYHTKLTKNFPNPNLNLGLLTGTTPIKIGVFYNDTDNNRGIPFAKNTITVNITPYAVVEYDSLLFPGYYNLTIYTSLLTNGNWTAKIQATRRGYNTSTLFIRFQLNIGINATLTVTDGCRWQAGRWWVNPDPYFDDQTHKVSVYYANGTYPYEGIEYSQIIGRPNWAAASWYGIPKNASPGFYDIAIDTDGLHEGDIGRVDIIAYSPYFETKMVNVSLYIIEIPANLLSIDAGPYQNITCYEGESIEIAMGYWDGFHERPILFENATMGNLMWQIAGTGANGTLERSVWQYEATISLPAWGILGTKTYDLEITAVALRDYAIYQQNLTLNVKSKENTTLFLTTWTPTEYRVGHSFYIYANLTYENRTPLVNTKVDFNMTLWYQGLLQGNILESRFTSATGIATYYYSEIPDGIDQIRIQATYDGSPKIDPAIALQLLPILPKYNISLLIGNFTWNEYRVGQDVYLLATLLLENGSYLISQPINFNISFYNGITLIQEVLETKFTGSLGNVSYYIETIPDPADILIFTASFTETKTILGFANSTIIPIGPKYNVSLSILSQLPQEIMVGNTLQLESLLFNEETHAGVANETVECVLIFGTNVTITRNAQTNSQGHAFFTITIPEDYSSYDSFQVEVRYAGSLNSKSAVYTAETTITVMTWVKYLINLLPYIGIAIAVVLGSYLSYRQLVAVPRRRRRAARMEKVALKYSDLINLQHILVIHSTIGSCVYQHSLGEVSFDADLIGGFLTALSAFEGELKIPMPSKMPSGEKQLHGEAESQGFELSYANFKVLLIVGHIIRTAFILAASPSLSLRLSAREFVRKFEEMYKGDLIDWKGAMAPFKTADKLIVQTFETTLLWPHIMESISEDQMKKLNSLESSLITLALTIQKEKQYFFLPALIPMIEKVRHASNTEILGTIDDLRRKGIFKAISIEELEKKLQQGTSNTDIGVKL